MKQITLIFSSLFIVAGCCKKNEENPPVTLPACIEQKIETYKTEPDCESDSLRVIRYDTKIGHVYKFCYEYCCCDYLTPIVDSTCNEVCMLGGFAGFTTCYYGNGDTMKLENPVIVWKK